MTLSRPGFPFMPSPSPSTLLASFQEHYDDLLSFLTRRLRDRHRAADVAQETWIKLAKIDPDTVTVLNDRHFIFKVAGNLAIDALRVDQRQTRNLSAEPPSIDKGEITDKGSVNQRAVLKHSDALVTALHDGTAPHILKPGV